MVATLSTSAESHAASSYAYDNASYIAVITLATAGVGGFAFGIASGIYLERGPDGDVGRIVTGVGSLVHSSVMAVAGGLTLSVSASAPSGEFDSGVDEQRNSALAFSSANIVLAALNFSLGVATLVSFDGEVPKPERDESSVQLSPSMTAGEDGATIGLVGRF